MEFDPEFWTNANAKRAQINTADAERSAGQFFATRDARQKGMGFMDSMREGMKNREAVFDPMFALKQSEMQANIAGKAIQMQSEILSNQIKKTQIDEEAADNLALSKVAQFQTWEERANALNTIVPKSARGIQQANMMRLQLSQLRMSDYTSRAMASIAQKNPALALRISSMEQGSPEWIAAIEEGVKTTGAVPHEVSLIEAAKRYRDEGDTKSADAIDNILAERGRSKGRIPGPEKVEKPFTITTKDEAGNSVTRRLTKEEFDAMPPTDPAIVQMVNDYATMKAEVGAGNIKSGPDWNPLAKDRREKMAEIASQLKVKGIDAETGKRLTQSATGAKSEPSSMLKLKADEANKIAKQNPSWTREQIINEVEARFAR